jgi:hypothetical protein
MEGSKSGVFGLDYARWRLVMSAFAPWLAFGLFISVVIVVFESGARRGAYQERSVIGNECRNAGAFTVNRTGFTCEVMRK